MLNRGYKRTLEYHQTFTSSAVMILIYKPHSFKREVTSELSQSLGQMRMQAISKTRDKKSDIVLRDKPSGGGSSGGSVLTLRYVDNIGPIARTLLENDRNWKPFRDEACLKLFHGISILCETSCYWSLFGGFLVDISNLRLNQLGAYLTDKENFNTEFRRSRTENHGELR